MCLQNIANTLETSYLRMYSDGQKDITIGVEDQQVICLGGGPISTTHNVNTLHQILCLIAKALRWS